MEAESLQSTNILQNFAYARNLAKRTSRGKNPDWYREAIDLDCQLHLFANPLGYEAFLKTPKEEKWISVPELPGQYNEEILENYLESIRSEFLPAGSRSLGIILHLQKDASVFEFPFSNSEDETEEDERDLRSLIVTDPAEVLQDRTLSEGKMSFRVFPTPAFPQVDQTGFAVAVSPDGDDLLRMLRELGEKLNFPIRTAGLSSPLLLLSKLPRTIGAQSEPFCVMLGFDDFSFFGFYSATGELILMRSIRYNEGKIPHNLESVLFTTAASVEIASLQLKVFDCRRNQQEPLEQGLAQLLYTIPFGVYQMSKAEGESIPLVLESLLIEDSNPDLAFGDSESFSTVIEERYHLQDYLSPTVEEMAATPGSLDMKIMRFSRLGTRLGVAACLLLGGLVAFSAVRKMSSPEWKVVNTGQQQAAASTKALQEIQLAERMLADRSKAWVSMELVSRLFPTDGSIRFASTDHEVTANKSAPGGETGLVKVWTIEGFANDQGTRSLKAFESPVGIQEVFAKTKEVTANSAMEMSLPSRSVVAKLDLSENAEFSSSAGAQSFESYPYRFTLNITQRIENSDPLAIPKGKIKS